MDGLVGEHDERVRRALVAATVSRERQVVETAADRRVEIGEPRPGERDAERVAAGAGERVALVAPDPHGPPRDARRLGREASLRGRTRVLREGDPGRAAVAPDSEEDDDRREPGTRDPAERAAASLGAGGGRQEPDSVVLLDHLSEPEVGVLRPRRNAGRGRTRSLAPAAEDELDLRREQEDDGHPDRYPRHAIRAES